MKKKQRDHGMRYNKLYMTWNNIYQRCYNSNLKSYKNYGGRGIAMSEEFKEDPKPFILYIKSLPNYNSREILSLSLDVFTDKIERTTEWRRGVILYYALDNDDEEKLNQAKRCFNLIN